MVSADSDMCLGTGCAYYTGEPQFQLVLRDIVKLSAAKAIILVEFSLMIQLISEARRRIRIEGKATRRSYRYIFLSIYSSVLVRVRVLQALFFSLTPCISFSFAQACRLRRTLGQSHRKVMFNNYSSPYRLFKICVRLKGFAEVFTKFQVRKFV